MKDEDKGISRLIDELKQLRVRVADLESKSILAENNGEGIKALSESAERMRLALEATADGIWDWDTQSGNAYFSPRYYTMLGYEPSEFPATYASWRQLIHPDDETMAESAIAQTLQDYAPFSIELRMKAKDGEWLWILSRGKAVLQDDGDKRIRVVGSHTDITEHKRMGESLRLARSIIDSANIGIYLIAPKGQIREVNQQAADLLGYSKQELESMSIRDIDLEFDEFELWNLLWQKINRQEQPRIFERIHRKKDGSSISVEINSSYLEYEGQQFAVSFVEDISERKENEKLLREKDRMLHDIGSMVKVGAWKLDTVTGWNKSTDEVARIFDFDPGQDVQIEDGLECFYDQNRQILEHALHEAGTKGTPYDLELELVSAKGVPKWVRTIGHPVMEDGLVVEVQGSLQDITDIKHAEMQLKESERRYRVLIESAPLGIGVINSEGIVVDANQAIASMQGFEIEELLGMRYEDLTHPEDYCREKELLQTLARDEATSFSLEKRYRHKSGDYFWINITVAKTYDIQGEGVFYFGFLEEISKRKKLEEEREILIQDLRKALAEIKELRGYIPICSKCKKIRDDEGYWQQVEKYIMDRTEALFSHSLCPDCAMVLYPDIFPDILETKE